MVNIFYNWILLNFREGIIQPSTIGEDGRPVPVSHILQLVENQPNIPPTEEHDDN